MKKLLSVVVAALSVAAMADVSYSPAIGVTKITTTNKNTIVAVPFTSLAGDTAISVKDLVCTNGIDVGSWMYVFKDGGYKAWQLADTGWAAATTAVESDSGYSIPVAGDENVASPGAIWVILKDAPAAGESKDIYIYGNYTNRATEVSVAVGNNLIANPLQSDATIAFEGTPTKGDVIIIPADDSPVSYSYGRGGWVDNGNSVDLASITVKMGQGFWYISRSATGVSKIKWTVKSN